MIQLPEGADWSSRMPDELEPPKPKAVTNPATGEVLSLDAENVVLACWLDELRTLMFRLGYIKNAIGDEVLARMDLACEWTMRAGAYKVVGTSPEVKREYDGNKLEEVLEEMRREGRISQKAHREAVVPKVEYKPKLRGIDKIRKLSPDIAERIDACLVESSGPPRRIKRVEKIG